MAPALQETTSQPASVCPLLEFLLAYNPSKQWFHEAYVGPEEGMVALPTAAGLGLAMDEGKIARRERLFE